MTGARYFIACGVFAAVAVPLALRFVPLNSIYGFRTAKAMSGDTIWYSANAFLGWAILIAACTSVLLMLLAPQSITTQSWFSLTSLCVPLLIAVGASLYYLYHVL